MYTEYCLLGTLFLQISNFNYSRTINKNHIWIIPKLATTELNNKQQTFPLVHNTFCTQLRKRIVTFKHSVQNMYTQTLSTFSTVFSGF